MIQEDYVRRNGAKSESQVSNSGGPDGLGAVWGEDALDDLHQAALLPDLALSGLGLLDRSQLVVVGVREVGLHRSAG